MHSIQIFWKNSIIYGLGSMLIRAISFFLLPLYTNAFTKSEIGYIFLVFTFISFAQIIYFYGQDAAFIKFYKSNSPQQKIIGYTSYVLLIITSIVLTVIIISFSDSIVIRLLAVDKGIWIVYSAFILFFDTISSRVMLVLRIKEKSSIFLLISLITVLVSILTSYFLVISLNYGVDGVFLGTLSGVIIKFVFLLPYQITILLNGQFLFSIAKKLFTFGFPFFISAFFYLILELSDRYFVFWILGPEAVGMYSIGYKIGSLGLFIISAFNLGWQPFYIKIGKENNAEIIFGEIGTSFILFLITCWALITFWVPIFMQIQVGSSYLIGKNFWGSTDIITIIFLSYIFYAGYIVLMPSIYLLDKQVWSPIIRGSGAAINIVLNIILINYLGLIGASLATLVAYIFMFLFILYKSYYWFKILCNWKLISLHFVLTGFFIMCFRTINNELLLSIFFTIVYLIMIVLIFKSKIRFFNNLKYIQSLFR